MSTINVILIGLIALFFNAPLNASPTSNEFVPCKKMAVAILQYCLEKDDKNCWKKSKARHDSCSDAVFKEHTPKGWAARNMAAIEESAEIEQKEKEK